MHAYLILAHNEPEVLKRLIASIDCPENDIYVHWDNKSGDLPKVTTVNARLYFTKRIDVRWGGFSMVEAEFVLFETAVKNGEYDYYHLISGVDLPIKSQDYIHGFCEANAGTEFIAYADASDEEIQHRFNHYFLFPEDFKSRNIVKRALRLGFLKIQDVLHVRRNPGIVAKKGSQWCSMTHSFVQYLISQKEYVHEVFKHTFCPDEMFIQTICFNSEFKERVRKAGTEFDGNLRYIKWINGELVDICSEDLDAMKDSDRWFARKFSSKNVEVINNVSTFVGMNK